MTTTEELYTSLFNSLIYTFNMTAMQQLGQVINPLTKETETDLEQASVTINMLKMLQGKTANNLNEEEATFLTKTVTKLTLLYDEAQ
jgi:hypothetical protein